MISIELMPPAPGKPTTNYKIAGHLIISNKPIPYLPAYRERSFENESLPHISIADQLNDKVCIFSGPGWLAGRNRKFILYSIPAGYIVQISGIGKFFISANGQQIIQLYKISRARDYQIAEAVIGPALILALALQGVWCLHASAVMIYGKVVAFIGGSGFGKSTLASFLGSQAGCQRIVDDILPITWEDSGVMALSHYPQLKIFYAEQPSQLIAEKVALDNIYVIKDQADLVQDIKLQNLDGAQSTLALIKNTVASRLFDDTLLSNQLLFSTRVASNLQVKSLAYPHDSDLLPLVFDRLIKDLSVGS